MSSLRTSPTALRDVVAGNVRMLRERAGWSIREFAQILTNHGWSAHYSAVFKIENEDRHVTVDELAALAAVFGVEPWSMTKVPTCGTCLNAPPPGFTCNECGASR